MDFVLRYENTLLDLSSKSIEEYDIAPSGVITIEESNIDITVCLPTGHEKIFSLPKHKKGIDLKDRLSVYFFVLHHVVLFVHRLQKSIHLIEWRGGQG